MLLKGKVASTRWRYTFFERPLKHSRWNVRATCCREKLTKKQGTRSGHAGWVPFFLSASGLHAPFSVIIQGVEWRDIWKFNDHYALYLDFYNVYKPPFSLLLLKCSHDRGLNICHGVPRIYVPYMCTRVLQRCCSKALIKMHNVNRARFQIASRV